MHRLEAAIDENVDSNIDMELKLLPLMLAQNVGAKGIDVGVVLLSLALYAGGRMELLNCLMLCICSFLLTEGLEQAGTQSSLLRVVDTCVDQVVTAVLNAGGCAFITADHGNAEKMMNPDGTPFTAHTTNVVPFVAVGCGDVKLREGGCLADIAPTMLPYIGLPVPAEMTGKSVIVE